MSDAPAINELPEAPTRGEPGPVFRPKVAAFLTALIPFGDQVNAVVAWINAATATIGEAVADGIAAIEARIAAAGFSGTSTTSLTVGTGSRTLTTQAGLDYAPGSYIVVADAANPASNLMFGIVTAYVVGTGVLTFSALSSIGTGTITSWVITLSGPAGPAGTALGKATTAEIRAGTEDTKFTSAKGLMDSGAVVTANVAGTYTLDLATGLNFALTLTGNLTFAVPSSLKDGKSGVIWFIQDGTGSRTLAVNASILKPGAAPTLPTAAGAIARAGYIVRGSTFEFTSFETIA